MSADGPLYGKYDVQRCDKAEEDPDSKHYLGCAYFVLDLDHDPYAAEALRAYAVACKDTHPILSEELMTRALEMTT